MNEQTIASVIEKLKALRMKTAAEHLVRILQRADTQNLPPLMIIEALVDIEEEIRQKNRIIRRFKQSRLLEKPTIDQFDFHFHISRQKQKTKILNLMDMTFLSPKKDVLFIGNTGVGKSFLAKSIAFAATQRGVKTLFTTAMDMINLLTAADVDRSLFKNSVIIRPLIFWSSTKSAIYPLAPKAPTSSFRLSAPGIKKINRYHQQSDLRRMGKYLRQHHRRYRDRRSTRPQLRSHHYGRTKLSNEKQKLI